MNERIRESHTDHSRLIRAMEVAGYCYDRIESTPDNLRFFGEAGITMTMSGWAECEEWLNGVVFDDPQLSDTVESILHPEQKQSATDISHAGRPEQNPIRTLEDYLEQNDNAFDGILNNMPEPTKTTPAAEVFTPDDQMTKSSHTEKEEQKESVLAQLRSQRKNEYPSHPEKSVSYRLAEHAERSLID